MSRAGNIFSIPPGTPFLPALVRALLDGSLVPGFDASDPLALAGVTIYLPTRRAAREARSAIAAAVDRPAAILPTIRALGEFDEDGAILDAASAAALETAPPIASIDRLLLLATLVRAWKRRLPAHLAGLYEEEVVVPVSSADAIWHARDLAGLIDEIETDGADWSRLGDLVPGDLANWWQVTLEFLDIVAKQWPDALELRGQSNPAAHRDRMIRLEAERLKAATGPVIVAGSTGSVPATAALMATVARLPQGAVVLPGLDWKLDEDSWSLIEKAEEPALLGHPQYGLAKLLSRLGAGRAEVVEIGTLSAGMEARRGIVSESMRPAETTDAWASRKPDEGALEDALSSLTLIEAATERDEALAVAIAVKQAALKPGRNGPAHVAVVTPDRNLARRISVELLRFGVQADDSGGTPLALTQPAELLTLLLDVVFRPGDPAALVAFLKNPLLRLGSARTDIRIATQDIELLALRGGTGRPDVQTLSEALDARLLEDRAGHRTPFWWERLSDQRLRAARDTARRVCEAVRPLAERRGERNVDLRILAKATCVALEALVRDERGALDGLYHGRNGEKLAQFLASLVSADASLEIDASEWPDVVAALIAPEVVKPAPGSESRISIWGALESRLQSVDTLVLSGLNEGTWPQRANADRFMSRVMKSGLELEPPERRIGLAAHDFMMSLGTEDVILSRAARAGDAPSVASRWVQRLTTFVGEPGAKAMRTRGDRWLALARALDESEKADFASRPNPVPPLEARPTHFSVTEIETLRRDPYAIYARRILRLNALDPLVREPAAAERGTLFHEILHQFSRSGVDARSEAATGSLVGIAAECFAELRLPPDVHAVWWPRFLRMVPEILSWEAARAGAVSARHAEISSERMAVGVTGVTLSGRADRIDLVAAGHADILDYKTGSSPSKKQAHTLMSPQLALEGALLKRGAFKDLGPRELDQLAFVRLRPNGRVEEETILEFGKNSKPAGELADEAWARLEGLLSRYSNPANGYLSRAVPFKEGETDGDYDHLSRVLEWAAGGDDETAGGDE